MFSKLHLFYPEFLLHKLFISNKFTQIFVNPTKLNIFLKLSNQLIHSFLNLFMLKQFSYFCNTLWRSSASNVLWYFSCLSVVFFSFYIQHTNLRVFVCLSLLPMETNIPICLKCQSTGTIWSVNKANKWRFTKTQLVRFIQWEESIEDKFNFAHFLDERI